MEDDDANIEAPARASARNCMPRARPGACRSSRSRPKRAFRSATWWRSKTGDFAKLPGRTYAVGFARTLRQGGGPRPGRVGREAFAPSSTRRARRATGRPASSPATRRGCPRARSAGSPAFAVLLLLAGRVLLLPLDVRARRASCRRCVEQQKDSSGAAAVGDGEAGGAPARPANAGPVVFTALHTGDLGQILRSQRQDAAAKTDGPGRKLHRPRRCPGTEAVDRPARCAGDHDRRQARCPSWPSRNR